MKSWLKTVPYPTGHIAFACLLPRRRERLAGVKVVSEEMVCRGIALLLATLGASLVGFTVLAGVALRCCWQRFGASLVGFAVLAGVALRCCWQRLGQAWLALLS